MVSNDLHQEQDASESALKPGVQGGVKAFVTQTRINLTGERNAFVVQVCFDDKTLQQCLNYTHSYENY